MTRRTAPVSCAMGDIHAVSVRLPLPLWRALDKEARDLDTSKQEIISALLVARYERSLTPR